MLTAENNNIAPVATGGGAFLDFRKAKEPPGIALPDG
jgi:3-phosphoglycerate kinase